MARLLRGSTIVITVGLMLAGCSAGKFGSQSQRVDNSPLSAALPPDQAAAQQTQPASSPRSGDSSLHGALAIARLSERRGQTAQAEHLYKTISEREPQNPVPYHRLGVTCAKEGRFEEADRYFGRALQLTPSSPELLSDIGYCYYLQHRLPEAEQTLRRALQMRPQDPVVCNNLAILVGEQGRYDECMALLRRVGSDAEAWANLAFVCAQRGELEQAKANYSRALTLNQDLRPAAEAMIQLAQYERLNQPRPFGPPGPPPGAPNVPGVVPPPGVATGGVGSPGQYINAQHAAFFTQQPPPGMPATTALAQPAIYRQSYPSTVPGPAAPPAPIPGAAAAQVPCAR